LAQLNWNVCSHAGRQYAIGVYHGPETGHLVVHCNATVMIIDFNVVQAKSYSFMLDDNLCELSILPKGDTYDYVLDLNQPVDIPEPSPAKNQRYQYYALGAAVVFFLTIYLLTFWLSPQIPQ